MTFAGPGRDFGGSHVFVADPEKAAIPDATADMANLTLQMMHMFKDSVPAGGEALFESMAAKARMIIAAAGIAKERERATREMRPVTQLPDAYGGEDRLSTIRTHGIPLFSGTPKDTIDVLSWLSKVIHLAKSNNLNEQSHIGLLIQCSSGGASNVIAKLRREGKSMVDIVRIMEVRYGELVSVKKARVNCNTMLRGDNESLVEFVDKLRAMAEMAAREEITESARTAVAEMLVESNIRRVLRPGVLRQLTDRLTARAETGLPEFDSWELEKECIGLEKERDKIKSDLRPERHHVRQVQVTPVAEEDNEEDPQQYFSTDDESEDGDQMIYQVARVIAENEDRYKNQGRQVTRDHKFHKGITRFNRDFRKGGRAGFHPYKRPDQKPAGRAAWVNQGAPQGPPNKLDPRVRRNVDEIRNLANVEKDACFQCGEKGHYANRIQCPLRGYDLMDRACVKCGQGLHSADICPRAMRLGFVAPGQNQNPQPAAAGGEVKNPQ